MEYIKFLPILEMCMEETISQKSKLCEAARITSTDIINRAEILHDVIDKVKETLLAKTENVLEMEVKKNGKSRKRTESLDILVVCSNQYLTRERFMH